MTSEDVFYSTKEKLARIAVGAIVLLLSAMLVFLLYLYYLTYGLFQRTQGDMGVLFAFVGLGISVAATVTYVVFLFIGIRAVRRFRSYYLPDDSQHRKRENQDTRTGGKLTEKCGRDGLLFAQMSISAVSALSLIVSLVYAVGGSLTQLVTAALPLWVYSMLGLYLSFSKIPSLRERHDLPGESIFGNAGAEITDREARSRVGAKVLIAFLLLGLIMSLVSLYLSATRGRYISRWNLFVSAFFLFSILAVWKRSELKL